MANLAIEQKALEIENWPTGTMPIKVFSALYRVKTGTIHSWISRKQWCQGREFCKSPTGAIHVILEGYDKWVLSTTNNTPSESGRMVKAFKLDLSKKDRRPTIMKRCHGSLPQLT